jgi:hypothetical protein
MKTEIPLYDVSRCGDGSGEPDHSNVEDNIKAIPIGVQYYVERKDWLYWIQERMTFGQQRLQMGPWYLGHPDMPPLPSPRRLHYGGMPDIRLVC